MFAVGSCYAPRAPAHPKQCGLYPAFPEFRENVEREVKDQLTRLRHHCSIVIYAGNNEDYQVAESNQLWDPSDESGDWTKTGFRMLFLAHHVADSNTNSGSHHL
jgi:beta-galactosidase/beta-glucuronidase